MNHLQPRWNTIRMQMVAIVASVGIILTTCNIAIVTFRPPSIILPVTSYELARALQLLPLAKPLAGVSITTTATVPAIPRADDDPLARSIRRQLPQDTEFRFVHDMSYSNLRRNYFIGRELELYGDDVRYSPMLFGTFQAAIQRPDNTWIVATKTEDEPAATWQVQTTFMLLAALIGSVPLAWLFSRRLERPIRNLAATIDELGKHREIEPLQLVGPNEIRVAAMAVNQLDARLKRFVTERTSLVGAVAHDLRTPLARLKFHIDHAPDLVRDRANADLLEIDQMIESTLDFVDNEVRTRPRGLIDLGLLLESCVDDMADIGRDVRLTHTAPATILADAVLLKRMFVNLLNNAVTYGQRAVVSMNCNSREAVIEIRDSGPGMSDKDVQRAFEPFYRAEDSRNRATGGIGLGLAIVKSAVETHDGTIELFNLTDVGMCARVTLPICG